MGRLVVGMFPWLAVYVGVWDVNKADWASDLVRVKFDDNVDDNDDDKSSEAIDSKGMTDKSESPVEALGLTDSLGQPAKLEEPLTDTDSLNEFPVNAKAKSLLDSLGFNIHDVL